MTDSKIAFEKTLKKFFFFFKKVVFEKNILLNKALLHFVNGPDVMHHKIQFFYGRCHASSTFLAYFWHSTLFCFYQSCGKLCIYFFDKSQAILIQNSIYMGGTMPLAVFRLFFKRVLNKFNIKLRTKFNSNFFSQLPS